MRYEALQGPAGAVELQRVYRGCSIEIGESECAEILGKHGVDEMRASGEVSSSILIGGELGGEERSRQEPQGFFGSAANNRWRQVWNLSDRRSFHAEAGKLLIELGCESGEGWIGARPSFPLTVRVAKRLSSLLSKQLLALSELISSIPLHTGSKSQ